MVEDENALQGGARSLDDPVITKHTATAKSTGRQPSKQ